MPNEAVLQRIEFAELIQSVDDGRDPAEPFRLTAAMPALVNTGLADLKAKDAATLMKEGDRAVQLGEIGDFTDARTEALANQAITAAPLITNPAHRYPAPATLLAPSAGRGAGGEGCSITDQLAIVNASQPIATGGTAQAATAARDLALDDLETINDRVRFFYCSHTTLPLPACGERVGVRGQDQTPELAKIGKQPRRPRGGAEPQPLPAAPGTPTLNAGALTLSVAALPEHATTLRAFRQPLGGSAELAGTSNTSTVSVVQNGPLTPGVTYELWLVGHNSQGDGPESNHVTHAVPVGP